MPSYPPLHIVRDGQPSPQYTPSVDVPRRSCSTILLCGQALAANEWIANMLEAQAYRVERVDSIEALSARLDDVGDSIALLDPAERSADLVDCVRGLETRVRRRVILATWRPAWHLVRQALDAGLADFVKLPSTASELLLRVELRARDACPVVATQSSHPGELSAAEADVLRLSDREYVLYVMLADRFGEAVSRSEILSRIWNRPETAAGTSNVVDVYVRYLRVKLAASVPRLGIKTVRGVGYALERRTPTVTSATPAALPSPTLPRTPSDTGP